MANVSARVNVVYAKLQVRNRNRKLTLVLFAKELLTDDEKEVNSVEPDSGLVIDLPKDMTS